MTGFRLSLLASFTILALAGCAKRDPVDPEAKQVTALPPANVAAPSPSGAPPAKAVTSAGTIPAPLQGRWGLSPGDCTSTRGDAKGLLVIGAGGLKFYESRAVPSADVQTTENSISGQFAFTGEGQAWTKYLAIQLQKEGLVRTETNPAASFTYAKCA